MHNEYKKIESLMALLFEQKKVYESLTGVIEAETMAATKKDIEKLSALTSKKTGFLITLESLEKKRLAMLVELARSLQMPVEKMTLSSIAGKMDESLSQRLMQLGRELKGVCERLKKAQSTNAVMIEHSLKLVQNSMTLLKGLIFPESVYVESGKMNSGRKGGQLLSGSV